MVGAASADALVAMSGTLLCSTVAPSCGAASLLLSTWSRPPRPRPPLPRRRRLRPSPSSPSSADSGGLVSSAARGCWMRCACVGCSGAPVAALTVLAVFAMFAASSGLLKRGGWLRSPAPLALGGRSPRGSLRASFRPSLRPLLSLRSPLLPRSLRSPRSLRLRGPRSFRSPRSPRSLRLLRSPRTSRLPLRLSLASLLAMVPVPGAVVAGALSPPKNPTKRFHSDGAGAVAAAGVLAKAGARFAAGRFSRAIGSDDIGAGWSGVMPLTTGSGRAGLTSVAVGNLIANSSTGLLTNS